MALCLIELVNELVKQLMVVVWKIMWNYLSKTGRKLPIIWEAIRANHAADDLTGKMCEPTNGN